MFERALAEDLRQRLSRAAAPSLFQAFDRRRQLPPLALLRDQTPADAPTAAYHAFCDDMAGGALASLLDGHPPLRARLQGMTDAAIRQAAVLAERFHAERALWQPVLAEHGASAPTLARVEFGLSDEHAGGKTVARLDFVGGRAIAYKPRNLGPERCFYRLLEWLGAQAGLPRQRIPRLASLADHGWMEWVAAAPCGSAGEVEAYFQRLGVLMAALRVLRGTDIHEDNLIAAGAEPVIVDLECLFTPPRVGPGPEQVAGGFPLLDSGLLPVMVPLGSGAIRQMGGAGPPGGVRTVTDFGFRHAGTDWMRRATVDVPTHANHLPMWDGVAQDIRHHAAACAESYRRAMEALGQHAAQLAGAGGLLERWQPGQVRHLTLATESYQRLAAWLVEPPYSHDRRQAVRRAGRLRRAAPPHAAPGAWQRMLRAERRALCRGDVPAFVADPANGFVREANGAPVGPLWRHSAWETARSQWLQLDAAQARCEAELLRRALNPAAVSRWAWPQATSTSNWQEAARANLRALVEHLDRQAVRHPSGAADWVRPHEELPHTMQLADAGLYHGRAGIAVFLAAAHATVAAAGAGALARAALHRLREHVRAGGGADLLAAYGPGHADGTGGMLAALLACAGLLQDDALLDDASALAERLAPGEHATAIDVHSGSAGLILSLVQVHRRRPSPALLARIVAWGRRLQADLSATREAVSPGLAHGHDGIAAAFDALARTTGDLPWQRGASQFPAPDHLDARSAHSRQRLPSASAHTLAEDRAAWCQGAPGLALCHAHRATEQAPSVTPSPTEDAIREAIGRGPGDLCCGDAGRLAVLLTLAKQAGTPVRMAAAQADVAAWMARWPQQAPALWSDRLPDGRDDLCLFKGLAGIGYVLALALLPERHASVLLPGV